MDKIQLIRIFMASLHFYLIFAINDAEDGSKQLLRRNRRDSRGCDPGYTGTQYIDSCDYSGKCCDEHDACYREYNCTALSWGLQPLALITDISMFCHDCNKNLWECWNLRNAGPSSCCQRKDCGQPWDYTMDIVDANSNVCPGFVKKSGVYFVGNDIITTENPSKESDEYTCCMQCYNNSECQSYTWSSVNKNCYLKSYSNGQETTNPTAQSGVRQGGTAYFAVQNDWNFDGNDLTKSNVSDYTDCVKKCANNSVCKAFTMSKRNRLCMLKSSIGTGGKHTSHQLSGYQGDYSKNFIRKSEWNLPNNNLISKDPPRLDSYEACASLCHWHSECYSFTWNRNTRLCFLKRSFKLDDGVKKYEAESGIWGIIELRPIIGLYGEFHKYLFCPKDSWAYGFSQRVQPSQGRFYDDTALNAVRLYCRKKDGTDAGSISSYDGIWGDWSNVVACLESNQFMVSASFKFHDSWISLDHTSANAFTSRCRNFNSGVNDTEFLTANNDGPWGNWNSEAFCLAGTAICGISSKFYANQGRFKDNTAMNGAYFMCCPY